MSCRQRLPKYAVFLRLRPRQRHPQWHRARVSRLRLESVVWTRATWRCACARKTIRAPHMQALATRSKEALCLRQKPPSRSWRSGSCRRSDCITLCSLAAYSYRKAIPNTTSHEKLRATVQLSARGNEAFTPSRAYSLKLVAPELALRSQSSHGKAHPKLRQAHRLVCMTPCTLGDRASLFRANAESTVRWRESRSRRIACEPRCKQNFEAGLN